MTFRTTLAAFCKQARRNGFFLFGRYNVKAIAVLLAESTSAQWWRSKAPQNSVSTSLSKSTLATGSSCCLIFEFHNNEDFPSILLLVLACPRTVVVAIVQVHAHGQDLHRCLPPGSRSGRRACGDPAMLSMPPYCQHRSRKKQLPLVFIILNSMKSPV